MAIEIVDFPIQNGGSSQIPCPKNPKKPAPGHARSNARSQSARDGDPLLLAAAQLPAAGAHEGVVLLRQVLHEGQLGIGTCLGRKTTVDTGGLGLKGWAESLISGKTKSFCELENGDGLKKISGKTKSLRT